MQEAIVIDCLDSGVRIFVIAFHDLWTSSPNFSNMVGAKM